MSSMFHINVFHLSPVLQAEHIIAGSVAAGVALVVILATIIVAYLVIRRRYSVRVAIGTVGLGLWG